MPRLVLVATRRRVSATALETVAPTVAGPASRNAGPIARALVAKSRSARHRSATLRDTLPGFSARHLEEARQLHRAGDLVAGVRRSTMRPLDDVIDETLRDVDARRCLQRLPAGDGVHLDQRTPSVVAGQEVDAGVLGVDDGGGPEAELLQTVGATRWPRSWLPAPRWSSTRAVLSIAPTTRSPTTNARTSSEPEARSAAGSTRRGPARGAEHPVGQVLVADPHHPQPWNRRAASRSRRPPVPRTPPSRPRSALRPPCGAWAGPRRAALPTYSTCPRRARWRSPN